MSTIPVMLPVTSSMFAALGFSSETNELYAQYNTGVLAAYGPTSREEFDAVIDAPSIGVTFNKLIKPTKKYRKIDATNDIAAAPIDVPAVQAEPVEPPKEEEVIQQTTDIATRAHSVAIVDNPSHIAGQELLLSIAAMRKTVTDFFKPMKEAAFKAHKAITIKEGETLLPLEDAQKVLAKAISSYEERVEKARLAEEKRLRDEQAVTAAAEAKAESERLAIDDAIELEEQGDTAGAEAVLASPAPIIPRYTPPVIVPTSLTRVAGVVGRVTWKARVVNAALVPREWLLVNEAGLNKHAGTLKEMAKVPGVEFYPDNGIHGRSGGR